MAVNSMTGYAETRGSCDGLSWVWEIRSVNNKGLDLRIRLPEGMESLEGAVRALARDHVQRGSVSIALRLSRENALGLVQIVEAGLAAAIEAVRRAEEAAMAAGLHLAPVTAADILAQRGVLDGRDAGQDTNINDIVLADLPGTFAQFSAMRHDEGAALGRVIHSQIDRIANLIGQALATLEARTARSGELLRLRVAQLLETDAGPDENRLAQELALLSVKSDVSEELDRLTVHITAARNALHQGGAIGRKMDFLLQEFNREANTLCSKSGSNELTNIGLDLKVIIDQAREQVQNLE